MIKMRKLSQLFGLLAALLLLLPGQSFAQNLRVQGRVHHGRYDHRHGR